MAIYQGYDLGVPAVGEFKAEKGVTFLPPTKFEKKTV